MRTTQLSPPLPMSCPKGEGFAHFLIDYGPESDLYWTISITATGEIWTYANKHVRVSKNISPGRTLKPAQTAPDAGAPESDASLRQRLRHVTNLTTVDSVLLPTASGRVLDSIAARYKLQRKWTAPQL
jgi:hypothetical protein